MNEKKKKKVPVVKIVIKPSLSGPLVLKCRKLHQNVGLSALHSDTVARNSQVNERALCAKCFMKFPQQKELP